MSGFLSPIGTGMNSAKAGQTVPIKFSLGGDFGLAVLAAGYPASQQVDCTTLQPIGGLEPATAAGGGGLYMQDGKYVFEWKTAKAYSGTCRQFVILLTDNTSHTALFMFK
jgi:hypothetical protein